MKISAVPLEIGFPDCGGIMNLNLIRQDNRKSEIVISLRGEKLVKLYLRHDPNDGSYYLTDENQSNPAGIFDFRVSVPPLE